MVQTQDNLTVKTYESAGMKGNDPTLPKKKNPRIDVFVGDQQRKSDGIWMNKERRIDKDRDHYKEVVIDPRDGSVVHHDEGPLSEHRDHGSAKSK